MADETLHVRFVKGGIVVELEGSAAAVRAELTALKTDGYGRLLEFFTSPSAPGSPAGPGTSPDIPSPSEAPLVPIVAAARSLRFVVNSVQVPQQRSDYSVDLNGDGRVDNQVGNLIGALVAQNFDVQSAADAAIAGFTSPLLLRVDTSQADLGVDQRVDVTILSGTVLDGGQRIFRVDPSRASVTLLCRLRSGHAESQAPMLGGAVVTLPVTLDLFADVPVGLAIRAAQMSFRLAGDGSSLVAGQINGAVSAGDVQSQFGPALARGLSARPTRSRARPR